MTSRAHWAINARMPARIDLSIKLNEMPKGMKESPEGWTFVLGNAAGLRFEITLNRRALKRLNAAAEQWPNDWIAIIKGTSGPSLSEGMYRLNRASLTHVYKRKPKPKTTQTGGAPETEAPLPSKTKPPPAPPPAAKAKAPKAAKPAQAAKPAKAPPPPKRAALPEDGRVAAPKRTSKELWDAAKRARATPPEVVVVRRPVGTGGG